MRNKTKGILIFCFLFICVDILLYLATDLKSVLVSEGNLIGLFLFILLAWMGIDLYTKDDN